VQVHLGEQIVRGPFETSRLKRDSVRHAKLLPARKRREISRCSDTLRFEAISLLARCLRMQFQHFLFAAG